MSSTCPYILAKTSQLLTAARITSQNENFKEGLTSYRIVQKISRLSSNLKTLRIETSTYSKLSNLSFDDFSMITTDNDIRQPAHSGTKHGGLLTHSFTDIYENNECEDKAELFSFGKNIDVNTCEETDRYFDKYAISDAELNSCLKDIKHMRKNQWLLQQNEHKTEIEWERFLQQKDLVVWRRSLDVKGLYEYKVFGTFKDISSEAFFNTQLDLQYRKSWDKYVISLDIIDRSKCGSEVVHWATKFPYPLKSRDYVIVRRAKVDVKSNTMVIMSRTLSHDDCPESDDFIRVKDYASQMVVRPHATFQENGFDFVFTYHDDSRVNVPKFCVNMITGSAVPDFLKTLHDAAANIAMKDNIDDSITY